MRIVLVLGMIFLTAGVLSAGEIATIPAKQQAIYQGKEVPPILASEKGKLCKLWTPDPKDTAQALEATRKFVQEGKTGSAYNDKKLKEIGGRFSGYGVQFVGFEVNGKKKIHCNFFYFGIDEDEWKERLSEARDYYIYVFDGGSYFWRIEFDPETGTCTEFDTNGEA